MEGTGGADPGELAPLRTSPHGPMMSLSRRRRPERTGAEDRIRLNARNPADARERVNRLGLAAGHVRLIDDGTAAPSMSAPMTPASGSPGRPLAGSASRAPEPPGAVHCPKCHHWRWSSSRGLLVWFFLILLFPVGLLLLLVQPEHKCMNCGYTYRSHAIPPGATSSTQFTLLIVLIAITALVGSIIAANWNTIQGF